MPQAIEAPFKLVLPDGRELFITEAEAYQIADCIESRYESQADSVSSVESDANATDDQIATEQGIYDALESLYRKFKAVEFAGWPYSI